MGIRGTCWILGGAYDGGDIGDRGSGKKDTWHGQKGVYLPQVALFNRKSWGDPPTATGPRKRPQEAEKPVSVLYAGGLAQVGTGLRGADVVGKRSGGTWNERVTVHWTGRKPKPMTKVIQGHTGDAVRGACSLAIGRMS